MAEPNLFVDGHILGFTFNTISFFVTYRRVLLIREVLSEFSLEYRPMTTGTSLNCPAKSEFLGVRGRNLPAKKVTKSMMTF